MPSSISSGTATSIVGTEQSLATCTSGVSAVYVVDASAMVGGDKLSLRIYTIAVAGGTESVAYERRYANAQAEGVKYSVPVPADVSIRVTLEQTDGTSRTYPWSLLQI